MENETTITYIGFWRRVVAMIVDGVVLLPVILFNFPLIKFNFNHKTVVPAIITAALIYFFYIFFLTKFGGTPGKLFLGYRIVYKNGGYLSVQSALIRYLPYFLSSVATVLKQMYAFHHIPDGIVYTGINESSKMITTYAGPMNFIDSFSSFLIFVDCLVIACNKKKRAVHDFLADSYVVDKMSVPIMKDFHIAP
ncbi:MAG TPA: RDD family protein [Chitinivibrionales bacterium]|nr:RDD family protein [Chitinivibrionales bacterium]